MLKAKGVYHQFNTLTSELISAGLCDAQNFPTIKEYSGNIEEVGINNDANSIFLKSIPYTDMYKQLTKNRAYNIKMIDGALITMQYRFVSNTIHSHRLSFFPSPNLESFQNEPDLYMEDELYADILDRRIVTVPLRFDFDRTEGTYHAVTHPISHLTIGQYKNCRIPVSTALSPYQFISFIIRNFYHTAHVKYSDEFTEFKESFESTIFDEEKGLLHVNTPIYKK